MATTILLADDHTLLREGLGLLIGQHADWELIGEARDGEEAVLLAERLRPQVVVLDVEMPGMNGIEAARRIKHLLPETQVVALSTYGDPHYRDRMFEAGASAYVLKNEAMVDLVEAVGAALRGARFVSPLMERADAGVGQRSTEMDKRLLSEREIDVLRLLAEGQRAKEIAAALGISSRTVETHRSRIMLKLGINTLPGLVKFALRAGLTDPAP